MGKVLHASGSGYFPFCLTRGVPPETGRGTDYPISLSLTKYMSWWWKVKTWTLTGNSSYVETAESGALINISTTIGLIQDEYYTSNIPSEENLVCQTLRTIVVGYNGDSQGTIPRQFSNAWTINFFNHAYINGSTIYPMIVVDGWYSTIIPGAPKVQVQLDPYSTFRIDGVLIPTYIRWYPAWVESPDWAVSGSQSFDLDPATYWPYS